MPGITSRQQARTEELNEFPITGPFGGIQSELPSTEIEQLGFQDSPNILYRKGVAYVRPGYTALPPLPDSNPALGIADFYTSTGAHVQVALTKAHIYSWNGSGWNAALTGAAFAGTNQVWGWDVVGQKLCFSQGTDPIWYWDGITAGYTTTGGPASANLAEISLHLVALNTTEGGVTHPQRYRWSGVGDPTDWTSFSSGTNDNLNNLGPGTSITKIGQYGFGFHFNGIVQIQPTGIGTAPFFFTPIISSSIGNIGSKSMSRFSRDGVEQAAFTSYDNVYVFNQSSLIPIGDAPLDGRRRMGARSRIIADIAAGGASNSFGFVTVSINSQPFNAYWLIIPGVSTWVYNFDESNWTVFLWDRTAQVSGNFYKSAVPRIMDLVGQILAQNWTPATLVGTNPFQGFAIGFADGTTGYIDFTNYSESAWSITGPKHTFQDVRHKHTTKKFRLRVLDIGQVTYTITVSNNFGQSTTRNLTIGNGSGDVLSAVIEFNISGLRLQWKVAGPAGAPGAMVEFCLMADESGEQSGGSKDENTIVVS